MTLEELYHRLNAGEGFILKEDLKSEVALFMSGKHKYCAPTCNLSVDDKREYIFWNHAGSSAVKNTLESLEWVLIHIFDGAEPEDFVPLNFDTMLDVINGEYGRVRR